MESFIRNATQTDTGCSRVTLVCGISVVDSSVSYLISNGLTSDVLFQYGAFDLHFSFLLKKQTKNNRFRD